MNNTKSINRIFIMIAVFGAAIIGAITMGIGTFAANARAKSVASVYAGGKTTEYESFQAAWSAGTTALSKSGEGVSITLLADALNLGDSSFRVPSGKVLDLNLSGFKLGLDSSVSSASFIVIENGATLNITQGTITGCKSASNGGAICAIGSGALNLKYVNMIGNSSQKDGAAIYMSLGDLSIINCEFKGNTAQGSGGAIYMGRGDLIVGDSLFLQNEAVTGNGGACFIRGGSGTITNCTLNQNKAANNGGAIVKSGKQELNLVGLSMADNSAQKGNGGAICVLGKSVKLSSSQVLNNYALKGSGGGVYVNSGNVITLSGETIIKDNEGSNKMNNLTLKVKGSKMAKIGEDNLTGSSYIAISTTTELADWANSVFTNMQNHLGAVFYSDEMESTETQSTTVAKKKVDKSKIDPDPEKGGIQSATVMSKGKNNIIPMILLVICVIIVGGFYLIKRNKKDENNDNVKNSKA